MATGWVKSMQCKSSALNDVYNPKPSPSPSKKPLLPLSCGNSSQTLRDVVFLFPKHPPPEPHSSPKPRTRPKPKPKPKQKPKPKPVNSSSPQAALTELPVGHSSRRVVEIIFITSWSNQHATSFPGRIEMLFRVHNPQRIVTRFEDYRSAVKARAVNDARCAADGNEMMRFHCAPSTGGDGIYDASVVSSADGVSTFAGSGRAHDSVGGGPGRGAMLVCRVIAGRVKNELDPECDGESVCKGKGELVVFDPRAVLPCFLIIYKV